MYWKTKDMRLLGMTLVEILVAMAIIVIVFAAIVPQIRAIQNSWSSKRKTVEAIQNGRVLMDHISFNLTQANKVTAVSDSTEVTGYIEFEDNDGNTMRYEIGAGSLVQFGPVGSLSELAGPVSQLQFACYDACDLDTPITDVNQIRSVKVQSTFPNAAALGRDQGFIAQAYLRTNALGGVGDRMTITEEPGSEFEFDTSKGEEHALCQIDDGNYLCAYSGMGNDGWSTILGVDTGSWAISKKASLEFDSQAGLRPALASIDPATYSYLCAYTGRFNDGFAVILHANPATGQIVARTRFEFDTDQCLKPALSYISSTDSLCVYTGPGNTGWAVILTADVVGGTVTKGTPFEFDGNSIEGCALAKIDDTHYLCSYGYSGGSRAVVLTVDTGSGTVTKETSFDFDSARATENNLEKIDQGHYLCVYEVVGATGYAVILTVQNGTWTISKGSATAIHTDQAHYPAAAWTSGDDFFCAYGEFGEDGTARVLRVDMLTHTVSCGSAYEHDVVKGKFPDVCRVDDTHVLCAYTGNADDGYATILTLGAAIMP
ncbi:MAG: PilW family protein [Planctomycetota bacterium]